MVQQDDEASPRARFVYDEWMESVGVPIHTGYYVSDLRTVELGWWEERGCRTAFVQLEGQEGVSETRITEIPPGETLPAYSVAIDEAVYVLAGNGATLIDGEEGRGDVFEWNARSLFLVPAHARRRYRNLGGEPVRLVHYTYLPLALSVVTDPDFFLKSAHAPSDALVVGRETAFGEAVNVQGGEGYRWINGQRGPGVAYWYGRFYPDMSAWDRLDPNGERGAGSRTVRIQFAGTDMSAHMSVFAPRTYKKGHRHGPGRAILIPKGEGYSLMWKEGEEKVVVRWQEGSMFVPPNRWFHQHFNVGAEPARYLAIHPPIQLNGYTEKAVNNNDQVEYVDEDPAIRAMFESELEQRGLETLMPEAAYTDPEFAWK